MTVSAMSRIKDVVVCKFAGCNEVYNDARLLPCGNRTCAAHIDAMTLKNDDRAFNRKMIACHFCSEMHPLPENGKEFPVDGIIPLLLGMRHCKEHDAAKRSFNALTQFLDKVAKFDQEKYVIDYFRQVEAALLQERDANLQKLAAYYLELANDVQEQQAKCLHDLMTSKKYGSELNAIKQTLLEHEAKLKRDNVDFVLKTLDGDEANWKAIQSECDAMLEKTRPLEDELKRTLISDVSIRFKPDTISPHIDSICGGCDQRPIDSTILTNLQMKHDLINLCKLSGKELKLLYRATRDGFEAASFHANCDNQANTLTVVKTPKGYIFGGYTSLEWDSESSGKNDPSAFLFSLVNALSSPQVMSIKAGEKQAIYCQAVCGPTFGTGHDLHISNQSNACYYSPESYSNLGNSYHFPLFRDRKIKAESFLAGSRNFHTTEIEVYKLN